MNVDDTRAAIDKLLEDAEFVPDDIGPRGMGGCFQPFYEETYKMSHHESWDMWKPLSTYHGAETPRGTKPQKIGGIKKSKQQRAALKARRKQR